MNLDTITETLRQRAGEFSSLSARVAFDLGDDGLVAVDATASPPEISNDSIEADCTIRLSAENMAKLMDGSLNPMLAYTLGKLKIEGSMGIAMKIAALMEE
jgi:putative sterol carrier protein